MWCPSREHAPPDWVSDSGRPACRQERIAWKLCGAPRSRFTQVMAPSKRVQGSLRLRSVERSSCRMACRLQDGMPMRTTRGIQEVVHNFASQFKCRRNASPAQSGPRRVPCSPTLLARSWFAHICRAVSPRPTGPAHPPKFYASPQREPVLNIPVHRSCPMRSPTLKRFVQPARPPVSPATGRARRQGLQIRPRQQLHD